MSVKAAVKERNMNSELDDEDEEDSMKDRYLAFSVADEEYGIEINYVTEIVGIQRISVVPETPSFIRGVINLRGQVIPVMDVRIRFHMPFREYSERTCVIVVSLKDSLVGLVVDAVKEVTSVPEECISEAPRVARSPSARYIKGLGKIGEEVKILLDVEKLLSDFDHESLSVPT